MHLFFEFSSGKACVENGLELPLCYPLPVLTDVAVKLFFPALLQSSRAQHHPLRFELLLVALDEVDETVRQIEGGRKEAGKCVRLSLCFRKTAHAVKRVALHTSPVAHRLHTRA